MKGTRIRNLLTVMALAGVLALTAGCGGSAGTTDASSADSAQVQGTSSAAAASEETEAASSTSEMTAAESTVSASSETGKTAEKVIAERVPFLAGEWEDSYSRRAGMNIEPVEEDSTNASYRVTIHWGSSAFETAMWTFTGTYMPVTDSLVYSDCKYAIITMQENGDEQEDVRYEDGTGTLQIEDDHILWIDDQENAGEGCTFEKIADGEAEQESAVGMANPWSETEDLEEAAAGSGIRLEAPMEGLPEHDGSPMNFWKYLWMDDVIEARYENINDEMIIRASSGREKQDLSGDYTEYSKTWTEYFKGVEVECMGDGETVNLAYFDSNDIHFSIGYQMGDEGRGLTVDELSSLIMGMYAERVGTTE
ncbi:MAG: hypothetical protein IJG17_00545 [Eubacterium sp.]|nr:hypothetical protein [Eubacterium sp.]